MFNLYGISNLLIGFTSLAISLFVFVKGPKNKTNRIWCILAISISVYGFGAYMGSFSTESETALFWWQIAYIGIIMIPVLFMHFVYSFLFIKRPYLLKITYIVTIILWLLNIFKKELLLGSVENVTLFFADSKLFKPGYWIYPPLPLLVLFIIIIFCGTAAITHIDLIRGYKRSDALKRSQIKYFLLGTTFGFIGGGTAFLPCFNINLYPILNIAVVLYPIATAYAIIKYRLMDINVVITRASIFFIVYFIVLGLPFGMGYILLGSGKWIIPLFAMAVFATAGPFVYTYFLHKAEDQIRREEFLAHRALNNLAQNMMRFTNLELLLKLIVHELVKIMKVNSAYIYLKEQENTHYSLKNGWNLDNETNKQTEFSEDSALVKDILLRRSPIILEELKFDQTKYKLSHLKAMREELQKVNASVVIPAFKGDYLFGLLILGPRRNNRIFTQEDLNLLMLLGSQAVLAIENAQLFEREKLYLAEKSRRDALADMAPGVSHQFNNRFIAINSEVQACLDLLGQKPLEGLTKEETISLFENFKEFGKLIIEDTVKGREIAQAIMKKGKADLSFTETALTPVIENSIRLLKLSRTRASLEGSPEPEIIFDIEDSLPKLVLSVSLMEDVFYNLVDNARDAITIKNRYINENKLRLNETFNGKIVISAKRVDKAIIITIKDNGIGIEKDKIKKLFSPFFTSKATAHKGTGMGLYVIQGMVEQHGGKISVASDYEKGTTFTIELPIKSIGHLR